MGLQGTLSSVGIVRRFTLRTGVLRLDAYLMLANGKRKDRPEEIVIRSRRRSRPPERGTIGRRRRRTMKQARTMFRPAAIGRENSGKSGPPTTPCMVRSQARHHDGKRSAAT
jgi:hypothetical protein